MHWWKLYDSNMDILMVFEQQSYWVIGYLYSIQTYNVQHISQHGLSLCDDTGCACRLGNPSKWHVISHITLLLLAKRWTKFLPPKNEDTSTFHCSTSTNVWDDLIDERDCCFLLALNNYKVWPMFIHHSMCSAIVCGGSHKYNHHVPYQYEIPMRARCMNSDSNSNARQKIILSFLCTRFAQYPFPLSIMIIWLTMARAMNFTSKSQVLWKISIKQQFTVEIKMTQIYNDNMIVRLCTEAIPHSYYPPHEI